MSCKYRSIHGDIERDQRHALVLYTDISHQLAYFMRVVSIGYFSFLSCTVLSALKMAFLYFFDILYLTTDIRVSIIFCYPQGSYI